MALPLRVISALGLNLRFPYSSACLSAWPFLLPGLDPTALPGVLPACESTSDSASQGAWHAIISEMESLKRPVPLGEVTPNHPPLPYSDSLSL